MIALHIRKIPARATGLLDHPLTWVGIALFLYVMAAASMWREQSLAPHYIHLADSFLHGQLSLMHTENLYDLLVTEGQAYVAGSPLPAIVLMPIVGLLSNQFSDILFSILLGAVNVGLVQALFRKRWLTLLFALGTPHLYMAALGSVWLMAHIVAIPFSLLALYAGWRQERWWLAGLLLGLAGLARPSVWFGSAFFGLLIWQGESDQSRQERLRALVAFAVPMAGAVTVHLLYNAARFGGPLDFGYAYTAGAPNVVATFARYGGFNLHFLPCNLFTSLVNPPIVNGHVPTFLYQACDHLIGGTAVAQGNGGIMPNPLGMSILLVTPAFLLLAGARQRRPLTLAAWGGLLAVMAPLWAYHNTGSLQFGYRYWMDATPFWLLLLATTFPLSKAGNRLDRWLERLRLPLIALSIGINLWGFLWIYHVFVGEPWPDLWLTWMRYLLTF